jgi:serine protease inhibitor
MAQPTLCASSNVVGRKITKILPKDSIISPFSLSYLLSMVHQASSGNTESQITQLLGSKCTASDLSKVPAVFDNEIVKIANIIVVHKDFSIKQEYSDMLAGSALITSEDFEDIDAVVKKINSFVEEKTICIKDLVNSEMLDNDTTMFIANTLYFVAKWQKPFNKAYKRPRRYHYFKSDQMEFMTLEDATVPYFEDDDVQLLEILCKNTDYCMGFIVPKTHQYESFGIIKEINKEKLEKFRLQPVVPVCFSRK